MFVLLACGALLALRVVACKRDLAIPLGMNFRGKKTCRLSVKESRSILTDSSLMRTAFDCVLNSNINQTKESKWKYLEFKLACVPNSFLFTVFMIFYFIYAFILMM